MAIIGGQNDFFGLDIGPNSLQVVQLRGANPKTLIKYGSAPVDGNLALSDSKADWPKLAGAIDHLIKETGIAVTNVAVGLASNRVFTSVIDMDQMSSDEMAQAIRYQADSIIPTPLAESKIDWAVLGPSPKNPKQVEVLLSSVPNDFIEGRLDMLESIGLNIIAFEPNSFALVRSLLPADTSNVQMILDVGNVATDLVIAVAGTPRLTRSISVGVNNLIRAATTGLNINEEQATQFVQKFGLSKDKLEGQVYTAILSTVDNLMSEIDKSIRFFAGRYPNAKVERIVMTGGASTLPEFPLYVANKLGMNVEIGNAWSNISFSPDQQNNLLSVSYKFAVAAGLAERE